MAWAMIGISLQLLIWTLAPSIILGEQGSGPTRAEQLQVMAIMIAEGGHGDDGDNKRDADGADAVPSHEHAGMMMVLGESRA